MFFLPYLSSSASLGISSREVLGAGFLAVFTCGASVMGIDTTVAGVAGSEEEVFTGSLIPRANEIRKRSSAFLNAGTELQRYPVDVLVDFEVAFGVEKVWAVTVGAGLVDSAGEERATGPTDSKESSFERISFASDDVSLGWGTTVACHQIQVRIW